MIQIKTEFGKPRDGVAPPYLHCANLALNYNTDREYNSLALFIEWCWNKQNGTDFAVSQAFTDDGIKLFVSAKTKERLENFLEWTIKTLSDEFKKQGFEFEFIKPKP